MANEDKMKALDAALANIEKQFGKGTVMKLGDSAADMGAGKAAGCKTAGVYGEKSGDESFATLVEFAAFLCGREKA